MANFPEFRLVQLLRRLHDGNVDYVVVGGVAVAAQGYGRATKDLDIMYATNVENLKALGDVLLAAGARLRGVEEDVPFVPDERTLRRTQILTLDTVDGSLDLLVDPSGTPGYATLRKRADVMDVDGMSVRVASLDDLLEMKRAAGRPLDLVDVEALEVARRRIRKDKRSRR